MSMMLRFAAMLILLSCLIDVASADNAPPPAEGSLAWLQLQLVKAQWQQELPGVEVLATPEPASLGFRAFRLAQTKVTARVVAPLKPDGSTADEMLKASNAFMVINGGFFFAKPDGALAATGMLIVDGKKLAGLKKCRACTGVLYTDSEGLHIVRPSAFAARRGVASALQVGPMLVETGRVLNFNADGPTAPRTAVCLSGDSIVVVAASLWISLHDLAALLVAKRSDGGLDCQQALNLDGGSSTQMTSDLPSSKGLLGYPAKVQNFVAFFKR